MSAVAARYTARVIMKRFLRPKRSVSRPQNRAPKQAPATYSAAATPVIWPELIARPLPGSDNLPAMLPTTVTSRPSRIHTVPRPMTIVQCQRDQGRRSSRAGMSVVRVRPVPASAVLMGAPSTSKDGIPGALAHAEQSGQAPSQRETL